MTHQKAKARPRPSTGPQVLRGLGSGAQGGGEGRKGLVVTPWAVEGGEGWGGYLTTCSTLFF